MSRLGVCRQLYNTLCALSLNLVVICHNPLFVVNAYPNEEGTNVGWTERPVVSGNNQPNA